MQFNTSFAFRQRKTETRHSLKKCAAIKEKKGKERKVDLYSAYCQYLDH